MRTIKVGNLKLRPLRLPDDVECALPWYQDSGVLNYSEGEGTLPYDLATVERMYSHLAKIGEVYIIEIIKDGSWVPIGDATLAKNMLPIVIGREEFRGKGIGKRVIRILIERAKELKWQQVKISKIYSYNFASKALFEGLGFIKTETNLDVKGREYSSYQLNLLSE